MGEMSLSDAVKIAQERIAFNESEIVRLTEYIAQVKELMPPGGRYPRPRFSTKEILSAAEEVLEQFGAPQSNVDIYEALTTRGIQIGGRSPKGNMTAKFATRKDIFRFDKETGLWSLVRWGIKSSEVLQE